MVLLEYALLACRELVYNAICYTYIVFIQCIRRVPRCGPLRKYLALQSMANEHKAHTQTGTAEHCNVLH